LGQQRPFSTSNDPHTLFLEVWHEHHPVVQLTPWFPVAGRYQVDFAIPSQKLAIEVDSESGDPDRWAMLDAAGWHVVAFSRSQVLHDPHTCVQTAYASLGNATLKAEDPVGYAKAMREQEELEDLYRQYTSGQFDDAPSLQWAAPDRHSALYSTCCTVIGLAIGVVRSNVRYTEMTSGIWVAWWSIAVLGAIVGGVLAAVMRRKGIRWMTRLHQILAGLTVLAGVLIILFSHITVLGWVTVLVILGVGTVAGVGASSLVGGWLDGQAPSS
jgi:hypothetical protein